MVLAAAKTSCTTPIKHKIYKATIEQILSDRYKVFEYYVDLNSSRGILKDTKQSSLMFLEHLEEYKVPELTVILCEKDGNDRKELMKNTFEYGHKYNMMYLTNNTHIPNIINSNLFDARGLVFSDDNGVTKFEILTELAPYENLDILIHMQSSAFARVNGRAECKNVKQPLVYLDNLNRKYWYIHPIISNGRGTHGRCMILGSNHFYMNLVQPNSEPRYIQLNTEKGIEAFEKLNSSQACKKDYEFLYKHYTIPEVNMNIVEEKIISAEPLQINTYPIISGLNLNINNMPTFSSCLANL